jgi:hypothetical protein
MKSYEEMEEYPHSFLTLALDGGEWSVSRPSRLIPRKESPVFTEYEAGWDLGTVVTPWRKHLRLKYID